MSASDYNYKCVEHCDVCGKDRKGTMHHATSAVGNIAPVLFECHYCSKPPGMVAVYRRVKWAFIFYGRKVKYLATTTKAERAARRAHFAAAKARINARRAAEGRPLIGS